MWMCVFKASMVDQFDPKMMDKTDLRPGYRQAVVVHGIAGTNPPSTGLMLYMTTMTKFEYNGSLVPLFHP